MGYVYTPKEWEEGRIATPDGVKAAIRLTRDRLSELHRDGLIFGANIHGSNLNGDGGPGSDIDVLVVFEKHQPEAESRLSRLHKEAMNYHLPIEIVPVKKAWAEKGLHRIGFFYADYLRDFCDEGIIGNDPLSAIAPNEMWRNPRKDLAEQLRDKSDKLTKLRISLPRNYDERHCEYLEKVIRQPIYAAVDMLRLKTGKYPSKDGRVLSKKQCCELFGEEFPGRGTDELASVMEVRNAYKGFLFRQTLSGFLDDVSEYSKVLREIEKVYTDAKAFMDKTLDCMISSKNLG